MESYIRILPPPSYIAQLDPAFIQLLEESIQLLRQGVPPHMKIQIPWSIMAGLTHIQTSPYGYTVHQSPQIEALIQIAAVYAYNSTSAYAQLVRHLHPGIESFGYHHTTHDICPCCEDHEDTDHDKTDELINDLMVDEESDSETESEEDYMESSLENASQGSLIERPHSAPLQLPSPSYSPPPEAVHDTETVFTPKVEEDSSNNGIDEEVPEDLPTNEELIAPVPFHPLVLATMLGPLRQSSRPRFEPIELPSHPTVPPQPGLFFPQSLTQQLEAHSELTEEQSVKWSNLVRQTITALKYFGPYLSGQPSTSQAAPTISLTPPIEAEMHPEPPGTPHHHKFVFCYIRRCYIWIKIYPKQHSAILRELS